MLRARSIFCRLFLAFLIMDLAGCGISSRPPAITSDGVAYELPAESEMVLIESGRVHFRNFAVDFQVTERDVHMNGVPYGRLRRGDQVRLTPIGRLYVNGVERRAMSPSAQ